MAVMNVKTWKSVRSVFIFRKMMEQMQQKHRLYTFVNMGIKVHDRLHEKYDFSKTQEILGQDMYEGLRILEENMR